MFCRTNGGFTLESNYEIITCFATAVLLHGSIITTVYYSRGLIGLFAY